MENSLNLHWHLKKRNANQKSFRYMKKFQQVCGVIEEDIS